jgi:hypothetical protein
LNHRIELNDKKANMNVCNKSGLVDEVNNVHLLREVRRNTLGGSDGVDNSKLAT